MKALLKLDKWFINIIKHLIGIGMIVIVLTVFFQVLTRHVIDIKLSGLGELSVYTMIAMIWLGGIVITRFNDHISIDLTKLLIKNEIVIKVIKIVIDLLVALGFLIFTYLSFHYLLMNIEKGEISPALNIPMWWLVFIVFISSFGMMIYTIISFFKGVTKWKS